MAQPSVRRIRRPIPRPSNEDQRVAALRRFGILDTPPDADFDFLTEMAAALCGTPFSFITLVDADRVWVKAAVGRHAGTQRPRDDDFCAWTILETDALQVRDLLLDVRTASLPPVCAPEGYRSYCGVNLQTSEGLRIGTLCVLDTRPHELTIDQMRLLQRLARQVMALIELRAKQRELHAAIGELERLSREDVLTGLLNRRALFEALDAEVSRALRYGGDVAVVLLDVDHFKSINDRYGHPSGDAVLRRLGRLIGDSIRCVDSAGRYGGEEFMLLLPQTSLGGAQVVAELLRGRIADLSFDGSPPAVTASFGVATLGHGRSDAKALVAAADRALYQAKHSGRDKVVLAEAELGSALAA
jgi:diguanylate cyclase (GGDEF)-like protein